MTGTSAGPGTAIVVGFDGSPGSLAALRWADAEAALRGVGLRVVHVWQYPGLSYPRDAPERPWPHALPDQLDALLRDALAPLAAVPVEVATVEGRPGEALVRAADRAELLVVGRRRHRVADVPLGSVGRHCAAHAPCPVVTVAPRG